MEENHEVHLMDKGSKRNMSLSITTHKQSDREDIEYWRQKTPEERLDMVELLRLEAGKFLSEYPVRFQRVIEVIRRS